MDIHWVGTLGYNFMGTGYQYRYAYLLRTGYRVSSAYNCMDINTGTHMHTICDGDVPRSMHTRYLYRGTRYICTRAPILVRLQRMVSMPGSMCIRKSNIVTLEMRIHTQCICVSIETQFQPGTKYIV